MIPLPPELLAACAPTVAADVMAAIVRVESAGDPLSLNINRSGKPAQALHPASADEAARLAEEAIRQGASVDIGLTQINSRNLGWLGYSILEVLDPCTNLAAGARILTANYLSARVRLSAGAPALRAALSAYNTGSETAGEANGYVQRVTGAAASGPDPKRADTSVFRRERQ